MPQRLDGHDGSDPPTSQFQAAAPRLVVSTPDVPNNYEFVFDRPGLYTLGRGADSDLRIDNPYVSSRHASIRYAGNILTIEDLGSSSGTQVNSIRITQPTPLDHGARIALGPANLELFIPGAAPSTSWAREQVAQTPTSYDIGHQQANALYQAAGNQYNYHQRYALRIAPMLDRARRLLHWGVGLMLGAVALYICVYVLFGREIVKWDQAIFNAAQPGQEPNLPNISFAPLAMLPVAFVLGFVGFVLVVVALMTRRRAHQDEKEL
jgi:hypothetical protein